MGFHIENPFPLWVIYVDFYANGWKLDIFGFLLFQITFK